MIDCPVISCEITLRWMSLDFTHGKSTLVKEMAWCHQATSHYLSQSWQRFLSPHDVFRLQWLNHTTTFAWKIMNKFLSTRSAKFPDILPSEKVDVWLKTKPTVIIPIVEYFQPTNYRHSAHQDKYAMKSYMTAHLPCTIIVHNTSTCPPEDMTSHHCFPGQCCFSWYTKTVFVFFVSSWSSHTYASVTIAIIGSDNGLVPVWHQAIIWNNDGL